MLTEMLLYSTITFAVTFRHLNFINFSPVFSSAFYLLPIFFSYMQTTYEQLMMSH